MRCGRYLLNFRKTFKTLVIPIKIGQYRGVQTTSAKNEEIYLQKLNNENSGINVLCLNRPKARNALSLKLIDDFQKTVNDISSDQNVRVLILRSLVPRIFCAGADLKERSTFNNKQVIDFLTKLNKILCDIEQLPVPVIAALDGIALGGGLEISLSCDVRVASKSIKLGLVETKLGIIPGAGGTQRLSRIVSPAIAKELIFTGRIIDGIEAHKLGIINHVVDQNESEDAAYQKSLEIAKEIASNGPIAIKMAKRAINVGLQVDLGSSLDIERALYAQLLHTKDRVEGYSAFLEKRQPKYTGE